MSVTDAAGRDGPFLTERLLQDGDTVHAVVRSMNAAIALRAAGGGRRLHFYAFGIREAGRMAALLRDAKPDEMFNLAGLSGVAASLHRPPETRQSNAHAVAVLLDAMRLAAPDAVLDQAPDPVEWTARRADLGTLAVVNDPSQKRADDPGSIVKDASRAEAELGWVPSRDLVVFMLDLLSSAGGQ